MAIAMNSDQLALAVDEGVEGAEEGGILAVASRRQDAAKKLQDIPVTSTHTQMKNLKE